MSKPVSYTHLDVYKRQGESNIPSFNNRIDKVFYQEKVTPTAEALQAIHEADVIVYGIGSLYTSILSNVIVDGIAERLKSNPAKKIYFCNAMTQPGETDDFSLEDHVRAIEQHVCLLYTSSKRMVFTMPLYCKTVARACS